MRKMHRPKVACRACGSDLVWKKEWRLWACSKCGYSWRNCLCRWVERLNER